MVNKSINCREVGLRLQSYLDGELNEDRIEQIRLHLDDCVACGLEASAFVELKKELNMLQVPDDSSALSRLRDFGAQIASHAGE